MRTVLRKCLLAVLVAAVPSVLPAAPAGEGARYIRLTMDHGLSNNSVYCGRKLGVRPRRPLHGAAMTAASRRIACLAVEALIEEATLPLKPGLVTPSSSGAHEDMDHRLLLASAGALRPCFEACAVAGAEATEATSDPHGLLQLLRRLGQAGEQAMYRATGGVNTHKGAIFCLGLLSAALGRMHARGSGTGLRGEDACALVAGLCQGLVARELASLEMSRTAGERLYREHGVRGARGQAEDGYPVLRERMLPLLRAAGDPGGEAFRLACQEALLQSMRELEDSCLLARGGVAGLALVQGEAGRVLDLGGPPTPLGLAALAALDRKLCRRRLSPGGSADMLAAGIFLVQAERTLGVMGKAA